MKEYKFIAPRVITEFDDFELSFYTWSKLRLDNMFNIIPHYSDLYVNISDKVKQESHWDLSPWHRLTYKDKDGVNHDIAFEVDLDNLMKHKRLLKYTEGLIKAEKEEKAKNKVKKPKIKKAKVKKSKVASKKSKVINTKSEVDTTITVSGDTVNDITEVTEVTEVIEVIEDTDEQQTTTATEVSSDVSSDVVKFDEVILYEDLKPKVVDPIIDIYQVLKKRGTSKNNDIITHRQTIKRIMGIDIGMKNMAAITSNVFKPVFISGIPLYKILDTYAGCFITPGYGRFSYKHRKSSQKRHLERRNDKLKDYLILCVDKIMELISHNNIDCVVIGYPATWGNHKKFNIKGAEQMTQRVLCRFKDMIKKRCSRHDIDCVEIDEAFTSKCSFLDNEPIGRHKEYRGSRTDRDTYITNSGHQINADVNASLNIIKKYLSSIGEWSMAYRYQLIGAVALSRYCSFNTEIGVNNIVQSKDTAQE